MSYSYSSGELILIFLGLHPPNILPLFLPTYCFSSSTSLPSYCLSSSFHTAFVHTILFLLHTLSSSFHAASLPPIMLSLFLIPCCLCSSYHAACLPPIMLPLFLLSYWLLFSLCIVSLHLCIHHFLYVALNQFL